MSDLDVGIPSEQPVEENVQDVAEEAAAPVDNAVADIQEKQESGEKLTKKEEQKLKEYRLKVNGREKLVKFNPFDDAEVTRYLQKAEASDSKFQEAAEVRKAAMQFIDELRKNPAKVLRDPNIGIDVKKFAEQILNDQVEELQKTPEQREREKLQKELEDLKKERDTERKDREQKEFERLQAEHERTLESDISAALDIGGLPKTPRTVKAMAEMMMIALENGIDLSAKEIAPLIRTLP
jgi:hypothetical protein